jgi:hypothetical protein
LPQSTCSYHSKTLRGLIDSTRANDSRIIPVPVPKGLAPLLAAERRARYERLLLELG